MPAFQKPRFDFSVIMAVYNTEAYLAEAIESILSQDYDLDRVQLILVDDGSRDNSPAICDAYAAKHPQSITVIHKKNGGVSSARNAGLEIAAGTFVNFLDSDDKLSPDTFSTVRQFLSVHDSDDFDVIALPIVFFDASTGNHMLNYKFKKGTRIIDLKKEPQNIQLQCSSTFIRLSVIRQLSLSFDTFLTFGEDAKFLQYVLLEKQKYAVLTGCSYLYRRRKTGDSAIQQSSNAAGWWLPALKRFHLELLQYSKERSGTIPAFLQFTIAYDLGWKVKQVQFNRNVLSGSDIDEYRKCLVRILQDIDDEAIMRQRFISIEHKLFLLRYKYSSSPVISLSANGYELGFPQSSVHWDLGLQKTEISTLEINGGTLTIYGKFRNYLPDTPILKLAAFAEDACLAEAEQCFYKTICLLEEPAVQLLYFRISVNLASVPAILSLGLHAQYPFGEVVLRDFTYSSLSPVMFSKTGQYYYKDSWIIIAHKDHILLRKVSKFKALKTELVFWTHLWRSKIPGSKKAVIARATYQLVKRLKRSQVWLITDRMDRAGDNGEALFRYIRENKPKGIKAVYALKKSSPDWERLKKIGPVIDLSPRSKAYKYLFMLADRVISSSADKYVYNPFYNLEQFYRDILANKNHVFLQHGVTKDDISGWLTRYNKNLKGIVTSAVPEYLSFLQNKEYCYSKREIWLTGMPRFDRLYRDPKRKITFMPTWRKYLFLSVTDENNYPLLKPGFEKSKFCQFYSALFSSERLLTAAEQYGYSLQLFIHPNMMNALQYLSIDPRVTVLHKDTEYKKVYAESDLIQTDYSSAVFDFAYLRQPIIYTHFDRDEVFTGDHIGRQGYFSYEQNGFGEVEYQLEPAIDRIIEYMRNDCKLKPEYRQRIDRFFAFNDHDNCKRVFEKIQDMSEA